MHRFLTGMLLPFIACVGWAGWTHGRFGAAYPADWAALGLVLVATPLLSALAAVSLFHLRRPRRWLLAGAPGRFKAGLTGLLTGAVAISLIGIVLSFVKWPLWTGSVYIWNPDLDPQRASDVVIVAPICFATAALSAWLLPRRRAGECLVCGYDVRFSLDSGRCPECGRTI